jgi:hypothetical protein
LRKDRALVPEPAGLVLQTDGEPLTILYRPIPLPTKLAKGDVLLPAHVFMSKAFSETPLGKRIFSRHSSPSEWFFKELAPKTAQIIYRSMEKTFAHLELHSQNIDLLVGADGEIKQVFVKDLLDMMHDPAAEVAAGRQPIGVKVLRDVEWKNIGEDGSRYDPEGFYSTFLGQTNLGQHAPTHGRDRSFQYAVRDELIKIARAKLNTAKLRQHPKYDKVFDQPDNLYSVVADLRDMLIKTRLDSRFRAHPGAKRRLLEGSGPILSSHEHNATLKGLKASANEYGFIGETPVAITRGKDGQVTNYFFRFE